MPQYCMLCAGDVTGFEQAKQVHGSIVYLCRKHRDKMLKSQLQEVNDMATHIEISQVLQAYVQACDMASQWYEGAGKDNPTAQRCYDARLDALQDMMDMLEQITGLSLKRPELDEDVMEDDTTSMTPIPSFTEQIVAPIKQRQ